MVQVNVFEAKNRLSQLIKAARAGEEVVIANRGQPVVRLVPADQNAPSAEDRGSAQAILAWLQSHPLPTYSRRSTAEIDASIDQERRAWD